MKKTLVALSVLAAASAQAGIEIYNQDGVTVNLKGDIEVTYQNSRTSSSMTQQIEDADFGFDVRYAINDQVSFGGYWEFDGSYKNNAVDTKNGDTYVAVYTQDFGSLKVGRLCTAIDDAGIGNDYQFGVNGFFDATTFECGDEGLRYDYDNGTVYATVGYIQNKLGDNAADNGTSGEDNSYIDGKLGVRVADFDFTVFYADSEVVADKKDNTLLGLEARFSGVENLNLSAAYYRVDHDETGSSFNNDTYAVAADYTVDKWVFGTGYSDTEFGATSQDESVVFINAGYAVAPNTTAYVELAKVDSDKTTVTNDNLATVGVKASF
ncbi:porin [Vibrio europaeus]|uniref:porin n=1 Tax=Vibrio europaeus TaxID=300876 RepID=UPI002341C9B7|nr:porin [Vibrio europaeus]MDC5848219.1 porin [Vibrio europaeus]